jgi:hypothetical protein
MEAESTLAQLVVREITGGRLSSAELRQVSDWANGSPGRARMLAHLRSAQWRMQEWQRYKEVDKQAVWTMMQARVEGIPGQPPLPPLEHRDWMGCVGSGAAASPGVGVGVGAGSGSAAGVAAAAARNPIKGWMMAALLSVSTIFC